jgi:hypothetical protein
MTESAATPAMPGTDPNGRARAITVITPLKPLGTLFPRLRFAVGQRFPSTVKIHQLSTVYFTRWSIVPSIPYNGPPQVPEKLDHPYLLWESDYSGPDGPYIEAFAYVIGHQIDRTWRSSYGFPGTSSITALTRYLMRLALPVAYRYSAYPAASVTMVESALRVQREHRYLLEAARTATPAEFGVVYRGFLTRRQGDL